MHVNKWFPKHFPGLIGLAVLLFLSACGGPLPTTAAPLGSPVSPTSTQITPLNPTATEASLLTATEPPTALAASTPVPPLQAGEEIFFTALHMADDQAGWGLDGLGRILHTFDGGDSWIDVTPPNGIYSEGSFFSMDGRQAWAASPVSPANSSSGWGGTIWHTLNGGETWAQMLVPPELLSWITNFEPKQLFFSSEATGWLVLANRPQGGLMEIGYLSTIDGGKTWEAIHNTFFDENRSTSVAFINPQIGFAAARPQGDPATGILPTADEYIRGRRAPVAWTSVNGGWTWTPFNLPPLDPIPPEWQRPAAASTPLECLPSGVQVIPRQSFHLLGIHLSMTCQASDGSLPTVVYSYLSPDEGQNWISWQQQGEEFFFNPTHGWRMVYSTQGGLNELRHTSDAGRTWTPVSQVAWPNALLDFVDDQRGWAYVSGAGGNVLVHSEDGGVTWKPLDATARVAIHAGNVAQLTRLADWPNGMPDVAAISPGWTDLVTVQQYTALQIWQMMDQQPGPLISFGRGCELESRASVSFSPNNTKIAAVVCDGVTKVWSVAAGKPMLSVRGGMDNGYIFSPDGSLLVTSAISYAFNSAALETIQLVNARDGTTNATLPAGMADTVAFSPDGTLIAFNSGNGIQLWRLDQQTPHMKLGTGSFPDAAVAFSPDGTLLASSDEDHGLWLWNVTNGTLMAKLDASGYSSRDHGLFFSPDGKILAAVKYQDQSTVGLFSIPDGKILRIFTGVALPVSFSPDGSRLALGSSRGLQIWGIP